MKVKKIFTATIGTAMLVFGVFLTQSFAQTLPTEEAQLLDELTEKIKSDPRDKLSLLSRAKIYRLMGDEASAIADLTKLISLEPDSADFYPLRASLYLDAKDYLKAKVDASKGIQLDSSSADASEAYWIRGTSDLVPALEGGSTNINASIADFTKAVELNPEHSDAYVSRGIACFLQGKNSQAVADFDKASELGSPKTDLIGFFREKAAAGAAKSDRISSLAGRYFFMMQNLRQKNLQVVAAVRISDQTIAHVKNAKTAIARRRAADRSYQAHIKSERLISASLVDVAKIKQLPLTKE